MLKKKSAMLQAPDARHLHSVPRLVGPQPLQRLRHGVLPACKHISPASHEDQAQTNFSLP